TACCAWAEQAGTAREARIVEASRRARRLPAARLEESMMRPRRDVSGTSPRTKSPQRPTGRRFGYVTTPRPTCSRLTTADGRPPGLRVPTFHRLPGTEFPVAF